jgi:hypothetical protein
MDALPPGAKGKEGAGRTQHSTNLTLGDPACYAYAHQKTPKKKKVNTDGDSSNNSVVGSTANSNNIALEGCKGMDGMIAKVID